MAIPEPESLWSQPEFGSIATLGHQGEARRFIGTSIGRRHAFRHYAQKWVDDPDLTDEQAKRRAYNTYLKKYLRCVKGVDDNLGRLFEYLRSQGLMDHTVIFYTGDQGMMLGEHDYQDKRWMYDESQRMPMLIRYPPMIPAESRTDAIVENVDFAPTMLDFAGIEIPESMQGRSFKAICTRGGQEPDDWKDAAYYRYWMHMAHHWNPAHVGIRTKQYKLIFYYGCTYQGKNRTPPGWELYDMAKDPHEVRNVYDDPVYAEVVEELKVRLAELRHEVGDTGEDYPEAEKVIQAFWDDTPEARQKAIEISNQYTAGEMAKLQARSRKEDKSTPAPKANTYIEAAPSDRPLRSREGFSEISRGAVYKMSDPGPAAFNVDHAHLLSGDPPKVKQHAFHSAGDSDHPSIIIKLNQKHRIGLIEIVNRTGGEFNARADGLTVWLSEDEQAWKQVAQVEEMGDRWLVDLRKPRMPTARFVKIGLPRRGTLHLNQVIVYGK